ATDEDVELQEGPNTPMEFLAKPEPRRGHKAWKTLVPIIVFWTLAVAFFAGHVAFFQALHNRPIVETIGQSLQSAISNFFPLFVDVCLVGCLGIACNQILWSLLRKRAFPAQLIDQLVHIHGSPWELIYPSIIRQLLRIKRVAIVTLLCAGIPFALVFPPGSVTTDFRNQLRQTMYDVNTMNISDYGNGSLHEFIEHSFYDLASDIYYDLDGVRPRLKGMASQVLASGKPVDFSAPCGNACAYNMSLDGPLFDCKDSDFKPEKPRYQVSDCDFTYRGGDGPEDNSSSLFGTYSIGSRDFMVSWYPAPSECNRTTIRSLACTMKLATYNLRIDYSENLRSIETTVDNVRDTWTPDYPMLMEFWNGFYNLQGEPSNDSADYDLRVEFSRSQTLAVREAAVLALTGIARPLSDAGEAQLFEGNASQVLSSPYIDFDDDITNPRLDISADRLQDYMRDLVISTISLNSSVYQGGVDVMVGTDVYLFNEKMQFYIPYALSIFVALCVNIYGIWCWWQNGSIAGNSLLQFVTATSSNRVLGRAAMEYLDGDVGAIERLNRLELKVVKGRFVSVDDEDV
ncbi:hypothetical protein GMORB2_1820, partial [Geosmithia morbida]